ncbi:MAG: Gfo/Idh/MocA family oxidoreductase [Lachnospiraceae bacterium]
MGIGRCLYNYSEMIKQACLDAVVIVSISAAHAEQIVEAMEAGLHVFSEKPMGVSLAECERVEQCVEAHPDLKFQLGFMRRFDPSYMEAKRKIDAGELGKPFLFKSTSNDPLATIDGFLSYATHSGGPWLDMSVHDIDLALWYSVLQKLLWRQPKHLKLEN